ncbi:MAG: hypothetical protein AB7U79_02395 [Candidatus Izemoplasmatales bacterium]
MSHKSRFNQELKKSGLTPIGFLIGIVAFVISGAWVIFISILFILLIYIIVNHYIQNKLCSSIISYYITSVVMSIMELLINYFPNSIGGGLFESGYIVADFITLSSIIDWIIKIQTDSWGIIYDWIIVMSAVIVTIVCLIISKNRLKK